MSNVGNLGATLDLNADPWIAGTAQALNAFQNMGQGFINVTNAITNAAASTLTAMRVMGLVAGQTAAAISAAFQNPALMGAAAAADAMTTAMRRLSQQLAQGGMGAAGGGGAAGGQAGALAGGLRAMYQFDTDVWTRGLRDASDAAQEAGQSFLSIGTAATATANKTFAATRDIASATIHLASTVTDAMADLPLFGIEKGFSALPIARLADTILETTSGVVSAFRDLGTAAVNAFGNVLRIGIASYISPIIDFGRAVANVLTDTIRGAFMGAVVGGIMSMNPALAAAGAIVGALVAGLGGASEMITNMLGGIARGIAGIVNAVGDAIKAIGDLATAAVTGMATLAETVFKTVTDAARFMSEKASDFIEEANKFNVAFRDLGRSVNDSLVNFGERVGRSQLNLLDFAGTAQSTFMTLGFGRAEAASFASSIAKLSVDLGSFFNVADTKAFAGLESGIMGNHRALRQFGIGINQSTLGLELMSLGFYKNAKSAEDAVHKATDYEKALARLSIIMRQTVEIQGDAERTATTFANTARRVEAMVVDLASAVGQKLNVALADFVNKAGGMDKLREIMMTVFLVSEAIATKMAELAMRFVDWAAASIKSAGGVEGILTGVMYALQYVDVALAKVRLGFLLFVPVVSSVTTILVESLKAIGNGFTGMYHYAAEAFYRIQAAAYIMAAALVDPWRAALKAVVAFYTAVSDPTALFTGRFEREVTSNFEALGLAWEDYSTAAARAINNAEKEAVASATSFLYMERSVRIVRREVEALGEYGAAAMRMMNGEIVNIESAFSRVDSSAYAAFMGIQESVFIADDALVDAELRVQSYEKVSVMAAERVAQAWRDVANLYDSLMRSGAIPGSGTNEMGASTRPASEMSIRDRVMSGEQLMQPAPVYGPSGAVYQGNPGQDTYSGGRSWSGIPSGRSWSGAGDSAIGGLQSRAEGGYIPRDMPINIHKGEYVLTAKQTAENPQAIQQIISGRPPRPSKGDTYNIILPGVTAFSADAIESGLLPAAERARRRGATRNRPS